MEFNNLIWPDVEIADFCKKYKIKELALFGSVLTTDFRDDSDVDVLVSFERDCRYSLFELAEIQQQIQQLLGRNVDIIEKEALKNPFRKKHILNNMRVVYAA